MCGGKPRDDGATWANVPGTAGDSSRCNIQGPLAKPDNFRLFQKLGYFLPEEAGPGMDTDPTTPPQPQMTQRSAWTGSACDDKYAKAANAVKLLRESGASDSLIKAAEAELAACPQPAKAQPIRDVAKPSILWRNTSMGTRPSAASW